MAENNNFKINKIVFKVNDVEKFLESVSQDTGFGSRFQSKIFSKKYNKVDIKPGDVFNAYIIDTQLYNLSSILLITNKHWRHIFMAPGLYSISEYVTVLANDYVENFVPEAINEKEPEEDKESKISLNKIFKWVTGK